MRSRSARLRSNGNAISSAPMPYHAIAMRSRRAARASSTIRWRRRCAPSRSMQPSSNSTTSPPSTRRSSAAPSRAARSSWVEVDLHFERIERESLITGTDRDAQRAQDTRAVELATYRAADVVLVVATGRLRSWRRRGRRAGLGGTDDRRRGSPTLPAVGPRSRLVFVGGFNHPPNLDGVLYFCRDIWPVILSSIPTAELTIIGNAPTDEVVALHARRRHGRRLRPGRPALSRGERHRDRPGPFRRRTQR